MPASLLYNRDKQERKGLVCKNDMTTKLRRLLKEKDYLMAPCAYDALTAKCIEASGFDSLGRRATACMVP